MEDISGRLMHVFEELDKIAESLNELHCYVATTKRMCEEHGGQTVPPSEMCDPGYCANYDKETCTHVPCPDCLLSVVPFDE